METPAAKQLRVLMVMKNAKHIATIRAYYVKNGTVLVNVHHTHAAKNYSKFQYGRATGYGYDKFKAALAGMVIDGHKMTDNCQERVKPPKGQEEWPQGAKIKRGYRLANFKDGFYRDCYREAGLDYLEAMGYKVFDVL
jgi:hypothetical protein